MLTEAIFDNLLSALAPPDIVALLSCLVMDSGEHEPPRLAGALAAAVEALTAIAERVGRLQEALGAGETAEAFASEAVAPALAEAALLWARGCEFAQICERTDVQEGVVVRKIVRLDETCRDVKNGFYYLLWSFWLNYLLGRRGCFAFKRVFVILLHNQLFAFLVKV